ncbi:hypothetical protein EVAR_50648_1 [Eumeta japonica]|uniref:Uncharacterized protein n=1 Tax=Eumeta variegata TaxID=151549 RepID=A0A4C1XHE6_EUMVA|nr:hypothetical protein EVAR_50648_1 [Eumeta japonica]
MWVHDTRYEASRCEVRAGAVPLRGSAARAHNLWWCHEADAVHSVRARKSLLTSVGRVVDRTRARDRFVSVVLSCESVDLRSGEDSRLPFREF